MIISDVSKKISRLTPTGFLYNKLRLRNKKKNIDFDPFELSWKFDQIFFTLAIVFVMIQFLTDFFGTNIFWLNICLLIIQVSRCIEIPFGFFADLIDKVFQDIEQQRPGTGKRMGLAIIVYFETALNYSLIYHFFLNTQWGDKKPLSMLDALYYSIVTISTVGYGDITPTGAFAKIATMAEITTSLVIIALSFTIYSGSKK